MKRGVFYTFAIFLLASSLLYLVQTLSTAQNSFLQTNTEIAYFEAAIAQSDPTAAGIKNILSQELLNISSDGTNVTFNETLGAIAGYSLDVTRYSQFITDNWQNANISVDLTDVSRPKIYILPQNITIDHPDNYSVVISPQNDSWGAGNITGYIVRIRTIAVTPTLNWITKVELASTDINAAYFRIEVYGSNGTLSDTKWLSKYSLSQLQLLNGSNAVLATIQLNGTAEFKANCSTMLNNMETVVWLRNQSSIYLGKNAVDITGIVNKKGPVGLLER